MARKKKPEPFFEPDYFEPEHVEEVEHDTVMKMIDGKLVEVTADDPEEEQRVEQ